ncbi:MAG TPA: hypothetical protein VF297_02365 [Pyrinomonadaceae bacterium]
METDYDKLNDSAEEFHRAAKELREFHATAKRTRANQLYKRDAKKLEGLERRLAATQSGLIAAMPRLVARDEDEATKPIDLDVFFASVANGYIKAQTNLDLASSDYLKASLGKPHVLPSVFRIPKLSAEVKFALNEISSETVNLIFFKNQTSSEARNEQTVQFEIVAAPPPPGVVAKPPTDALIAPIFVTAVFSKLRRAEILDAVKRYRLPGDNTAGGTVTDNMLDRTNLLKDPDAVIILSLEGDRRFLLTTADQGNLPAGGSVGVWYFETDPAALAVLRKFGGAADKNIELVRALVAALGKTQKQFLKELA